MKLFWDVPDQHVEVPRSGREELRLKIARLLRRDDISTAVWTSKTVRGARKRYDLVPDEASFDDLVADVKALIERYREAAGLRSTAPKSPRRRDLKSGTLSSLESARAFAYGEVLAADAFESPDVQYVWSEVLRKRWLSPRQAEEFLASPAIRLVPYWSLVTAGIDLIGLESEFIDRRLQPDGSWRAEVSVPSQTRSWSVSGSILPGPEASGIIADERVEGHKLAVVRDASGVVFNVGYWTASTLDELCKRAVPLREEYGWEEYDAIWFMLTAQAPRLRPLTGSISNDLTGRVQLTISPWISDHSLLAFMRRLRFVALGRATVRTNALSFEVFAFVERQTTLAGGKQPGWEVLRGLWNDSVRAQHQFSRNDQLRTRYSQARRVIRRYFVAADARGLGRWEKS